MIFEVIIAVVDLFQTDSLLSPQWLVQRADLLKSAAFMMLPAQNGAGMSSLR